MTKQLKALGEISDMILDLKLASLQKVSRKAAGIEAEIAALEAARQGRAAALSKAAMVDPAQVAGRDEAWKIWMQNARRAHNSELAKLYAEREERMADARHAMGRADVIKSLMKKRATKRVG